MVAPALIYTGLVLTYQGYKMYASKDRYKAEAQTQSDKLGYKFDMVKDNLSTGDAFRHMYAAAKSTVEYGSRVSEFGGYAVEGKEFFFPTPGFESDADPRSPRMDLHNNDLGRQIGKEVGDLARKNDWTDSQIQAEIAKRVDQKIKNGDAIILDKDGEDENGNPRPKGDLKRGDDRATDPCLDISYNKANDNYLHFKIAV